MCLGRSCAVQKVSELLKDFDCKKEIQSRITVTSRSKPFKLEQRSVRHVDSVQSRPKTSF